MFTLGLSPRSFKEWTLTTSLAQWPSEASEVSSVSTPRHPWSPWCPQLVYKGRGAEFLGRYTYTAKARDRVCARLKKRAVGTLKPTISFSIAEMVAERSHLGPKPANKQKAQQVSFPPPSSLCLCPPQALGPKLASSLLSPPLFVHSII